MSDEPGKLPPGTVQAISSGGGGADIRNPNVPISKRSPLLTHLRAKMITGMLTAIPLFITLWILTILFDLVTKFTRGPANWIVDSFLKNLMGAYVSDETLKSLTSPVLAILISLLIVYLLGVLGTFFVGRRILAALEHFISNLPLIKGIYGTTKQVIGVFRQGGGGGGFQRVVLVQFPREGTWTIAFVTNTVTDATNHERLVCCFIPMTPNPTSGFFQLFPEGDVRNTDWTVDMGLKIVLSGGLLAPSILEVKAAGLPAVVTSEGALLLSQKMAAEGKVESDKGTQP